MQPGKPPVQQEMTLEKRARWGIFLNYFSQQFGIFVALNFTNLYMTNFLLMAPFVVASILTFGRIIDTAVSFIAGSVVQKGNSKLGPYRIWILVNGPLIGFGNLLMFLNPNVGETAKLVIFMIGFMFRSLPQNFYIAAQNTLIGKVGGSNIANRMELTAKTQQGMNTAAIIVSAITIPIITYINDTIGNGRGYLIVAVSYCIIQTIFQVVTYFFLAPYDQYDPDAKKIVGSAVQTKLTHVYTDSAKNPYVWLLFLAGTLTQLSMNTLTPLSAYLFMYSFGNANLMSVNRTVSSIVGLAVAFLAPPIAKKLGKKNSIVIGQIAGFASNCIYFLFVHGNAYLYLGGTILVRILQGPMGSVGINLWLDASEYQQFKTGRDSRPFIMSLNSITLKLGQLISNYSYAWVLAYSSFVSLGAGEASVDALKMVQGLFGFMAVCSGLTIILYLSFRMTDQQAAEYAEHNRKVMAERAAAVAAETASAGVKNE